MRGSGEGDKKGREQKKKEDVYLRQDVMTTNVAEKQKMRKKYYFYGKGEKNSLICSVPFSLPSQVL